MIEIIYNIVPGNLFPVLTNPSIYYPFAYYEGIFLYLPRPLPAGEEQRTALTLRKFFRVFDKHTIENCLSAGSRGLRVEY